jgi:hypothetical protein
MRRSKGNERKNIISGISNGKTKTEYALGYGACPKETGV